MKHGSERPFGMIRVPSGTVEMLRKMGVKLEPVKFPLIEIGETKLQPLKPVKERRWDFIKYASDLAKADNESDL